MRVGCAFDPASALAASAFKSLAARYDLIRVESQSVLPSCCDVVLALGGDGAMLRALHMCMQSCTPVFGMNRGSIGFLMNHYGEEGLLDRINRAQISYLSPLEVHVFTLEGVASKLLAFNEVSLLREHHQAAKIRVGLNGEVRLDCLVGDGVLVATPAGSTAYNYAVGGPIIPIDANVLAISPINPFRPRQWRGALILRSDEVFFEIIEPAQRAVSVSADFNEIRRAQKIVVSERSDIKMPVLFDPENALTKRALKEQFM